MRPSGRERCWAGSIRRGAVLLLCILLPAFAENGFKVVYEGGSVPGFHSGDELRLILDSKNVRLSKLDKDVLAIPTSAITELSYGQKVVARVKRAMAVTGLGSAAFVAVTKSSKPYIGITWVDGDRKGGLAFQCDKSDYRNILAALEAATEKKAVDSEARTVKN
jgi:hypothetical protein